MARQYLEVVSITPRINDWLRRKLRLRPTARVRCLVIDWYTRMWRAVIADATLGDSMTTARIAPPLWWNPPQSMPTPQTEGGTDGLEDRDGAGRLRRLRMGGNQMDDMALMNDDDGNPWLRRLGLYCMLSAVTGAVLGYIAGGHERITDAEASWRCPSGAFCFENTSGGDIRVGLPEDSHIPVYAIKRDNLRRPRQVRVDAR